MVKNMRIKIVPPPLPGGKLQLHFILSHESRLLPYVDHCALLFELTQIPGQGSLAVVLQEAL